MRVAAQALAAHHPLRARAVRAVADHQELGGNLFANQREGFDDVGNALDGTEIGEVDEDLFVVRSELRAPRTVFGREEDVTIHEVRDKLDRAANIKFLKRHLAQVFGDGRHRVALLDGKPRDGEVGPVLPDQRDVGAVERGDERQLPAVLHGARQVGRHGVREGIVNVQQVQVLSRRHVVHHGRQGQGVGRMIEQRVAHDLHFVEMDALARLGHPHRNGVADEVHIVPPGRQFQAQFGRNHAAAAVSGVTRDADFHLRGFGCATRQEDVTRKGETSCLFLRSWAPGSRYSAPSVGRPSARSKRGHPSRVGGP